MPNQLPKKRITTKSGIELDLSPLASGDESLLGEDTKRKFAPHSYDVGQFANTSGETSAVMTHYSWRNRWRE